MTLIRVMRNYGRGSVMKAALMNLSVFTMNVMLCSIKVLNIS